MIVAAVVFDPTISFGAVVQIASWVVIVVGAYFAWKQQISVQLAQFKGTLDHHANTIAEHTAKFGSVERDLKDVSNNLQRLMGRLEVTPERRRTARD